MRLASIEPSLGGVMRRFISINRQRILTGLACSAVFILAWAFGATSHVLGAIAWSTIFLMYFEVTRWWKVSKGFPPNHLFQPS
ncbi:hypothetical protein ATY30_13585 [Sinorhizobium americanum]|uniref:Transmembrane protein n=1 Tax=Sinorhizobium americanum TaxID=194963 RepID=A0A2S3YQ70_9HYPH|nr:hypothetical protein CO656_27760 [Sinorhizobium sp. FG01]PDT48305.1 hypothetical protein CO664_28950 [Sinorhizobium sp. NG07B]POH29945.1 hypothetical protein ATY30_13585 [Sinorhizobium americanum]POH33197.1 hypothetical protein ATY31_11090 [Sinorhizobium americanum]